MAILGDQNTLLRGKARADGANLPKTTGSWLHSWQINISRDPLNNKKLEESKLKRLIGINVW